MKTMLTRLMLPVMVFAAVSGVRSQVTPVSKSPTRAKLQQMQQQNAKLLEQQNATLQKLDTLLKDAEQVKIFARRT